MPIKLEDAFSNLSMSYVTNIFGIRFYIQTRKTNQNRSQSKLTHQNKIQSLSVYQNQNLDSASLI